MIIQYYQQFIFISLCILKRHSLKMVGDFCPVSRDSSERVAIKAITIQIILEADSVSSNANIISNVQQSFETVFHINLYRNLPRYWSCLVIQIVSHGLILLPICPGLGRFLPRWDIFAAQERNQVKFFLFANIFTFYKYS